MIKTHEINLNTSTYNTIINHTNAIIEDDKIGEGDYVLFKQVETEDGKQKETGLYSMVCIKSVVSNHPGLKDGYILITYSQIS